MADDSASRPKGVYKKLEPGTYTWCGCGRTQDVPFCDRSVPDDACHAVPFKVDETSTLKLCNCGRTKSPPRCDSSHNA